MRQKSVTEIVRETVDYYTKNPRSRVQDLDDPHYPACYYFHPTTEGAMCAVGRCLDSEHPHVKAIRDNPADHKDNVGSVEIFYDDDNDIDDFLKEEYQGHSKEFWTDLQTLHDGNRFWGNLGITWSGQEKAEEIIRRYEQVVL
jgi:hypothetical protein